MTPRFLQVVHQFADIDEPTPVQGGLLTWGLQDSDSLGNDRLTPNGGVVLTPTQIASFSTAWSQVAAGDDNGFAIKNGELWGWGNNASRQLGIPSGLSYRVPERVDSNTNWRRVSVGNEHSLGLRDNRLYGWGSNSFGAGVLLTSGTVSTPTEITLAENGANIADNWSQITTGQNWSLGVRDGRIYGWGQERFASLGLRPLVDGLWPPRPRPVLLPGVWLLNSPGVYSYQQLTTSNNNWTAVSASKKGYHSLGIWDGKLFGWGYSPDYAHGTLNGPVPSLDPRFITQPTQITSSTGWTHVSAGSRHSLAIRNGRLYSWGSNSFDLTGLGLTSGWTTEPTQVGTHSDWTAISAGAWHSLAIRNNRLYVWGDAFGPGLGLTNDELDSYDGTPIQIGSSSGWVTAKAGTDWSVGIRNQ